jgi:hypothetical protein
METQGSRSSKSTILPPTVPPSLPFPFRSQKGQIWYFPQWLEQHLVQSNLECASVYCWLFRSLGGLSMFSLLQWNFPGPLFILSVLSIVSYLTVLPMYYKHNQWWLILIIDMIGLRRTPLDVFVKAYPERFNYTGKVPPKCGYHHLTGWGPRWNQRGKKRTLVSVSILSASWLPWSKEPLWPPWAETSETMSQNISFLP